MIKSKPPLSCNKCSFLALAVLDEVPLCLSCLIEAVKMSADPYFIYKIEPLELEPCELKGLAKHSSGSSRPMIAGIGAHDPIF
ncbi:MAG: hypothetical protein GY847_26815 [Proteobacteria bacterium]|nr:hypothetical protein [Pseudomonadota bacterium]